jgi:glycosidase
MKRFLSALILLFLGLNLFSQIVTTVPDVPVTDQPVTVTFDATQGNGGLAGYTGDVYAHTGVITDQSSSGSDWKYVKTNWGQNTPETKLTRISTDRYSLEITPTIREYYGVPVNEKILKMAFVFRSATPVGGSYLEGKTETGGDIFVDVIEAGLNIGFLQPATKPSILQQGDSLVVEVQANQSDSVILYFQDAIVKRMAGTYLIDTITPATFGNYLVKAIAKNDTAMVADSFMCYVNKPVTIQERPSGVRDGINYLDQSTVILSLLAPKKKFIYVIGDFNDWQIDTSYYMKMTPDSLRFWLRINNLIPGKEYIFQYFIDGSIRVGDPYADKTSDPWNDQYIDNNTYPGLIQYPQGKTTGIATVLQTNQAPYPWQVTNFTPPDKKKLVVYELLVRDFTQEHTYQGIIDTLGYLQRLGVNAIELMPVNEFDGNISWGYNPIFYFAPDKYYGPKNDLKKFIDDCHARGIAVLLDLVLNHAYDNCPLVQMYFDGQNPTPDNPWFNVHSNFTNPDAQWGNDFNQESPYTQQLVDSINSYWMKEYHVDGFRFDFTKGFGNNIKDLDDPWGSLYDEDRIELLERMADQIWTRKPDAIVIFEHFAENSEETVLADHGMLLWGNLNYNYAEGAMGYNDNGVSDFSWISWQKRGWDQPNVMGYMESHDEERLMFKCIKYGASAGDYNIKDTTIALQRMALDAVFFLTIPGPKMILQFGELGYDYSIDFNGRTGPKPVRWDYTTDFRRKYLYNFYSSLISLKTEQPVFETDNYTLGTTSSVKRIDLFSPGMNVVIIGNFGVVQNQILPGFNHLGQWFEYFTGDTLTVASTTDAYMLAPGEYRMFTDVKLTKPDIGTGIEEPGNQDNTSSFRIFPNPGESFNIVIDLPVQQHVSVEIFDITGRKQSDITRSDLGRGTHQFYWDGTGDKGTRLPPGVYICRVITGNEILSKKIILE